MSYTTSIRTILTSDANITSAVSARIYSDVAPIGVALPCIVFEVTDIEGVETKDTAYNIDLVRVSLRAFSTTRLNCESLSVLVRSAFTRYKGTVSGVKFDSCKFNGQSFGFIEEEREYVTMMNFEFRIKY
jgi:hypothetical protein